MDTETPGPGCHGNVALVIIMISVHQLSVTVPAVIPASHGPAPGPSQSDPPPAQLTVTQTGP